VKALHRWRLRRRCLARVRELSLPVPFDVRALCHEVAARRGRPLRLVPMTGLTDVCGLWISTDAMDLICYESDTTRPHQEHIILHELSHVLCEHYPVELPTRTLLPDLDPAMVRTVLGRAGYSTDEEREAETLASLIRQHATTRARGTLHTRLHGALDDALDDDRG
jgi:hypothetical protein